MFSLFTTFFLTPNDNERQKELLHCLDKNNANKFISNIYILLDGKEEEQTKRYIQENIKDSSRIKFVNIKRVPTYGDWIQYSKWFLHELGEVSIFTNADVYLDETIEQIKDYTKEQESIVCLSRHELISETELTPHPNPQWSQDLWAISKENISNITSTFFMDELSITTTGVYRCDNKLAYLFAMRGWKIFNPFPAIKCIHLQKSPARSYGKLDTNIVGGLCFPAPTNDSSAPSILDISVMPVRVGNITKCAINKYLERNLFPEVQKPTIEVVKEFKPMYVWPNKAFPFREYFTSDKLKIFIIENIVHNYEWLNAYKDKITDKHFFFVLLGWNHTESFWKQTKQIFSLLNLNIQNFYFLCNSVNELNLMKNVGLCGDLINQNAWLDESLYSIKQTEKMFDAIYTARKAKFKRHYLANKVNNLALIAGGSRHGNNEEIILPAHKFNNEKQLTLEEVTEKINQSKVGLCLSKEEGACFSSSEYLLCGIPVVSTKSEGGRDFWYDDFNSIICEDNEESVAEAVNFFLNNKRDPEIIRSNHIALAKQQRAKFIKVLQQVFYKYNIDINAFIYFRDNYTNKMRKSYTPEMEKIFI